MTSTVTLRNMEPPDWPSVRRIYQEGIDTGQATFETQAPDWDSFDRSRLPGHRHVAASTYGQVLGWAAASPTSSRPAYAGVVEHSIYVTAEACGFGLGKALLNALINSTESAGIWTIQATVFPENGPSLRLHQTAGLARPGQCVIRIAPSPCRANSAASRSRSPKLRETFNTAAPAGRSAIALQ
ncbi:N-acetyltransferase family protein [Arthrobacter sp. UYEF6]|uniref:GNAT family N-acetyltransferase n=1 Tax=Pseudarthrobacter sp. S6 TaxID=3418420 RepID=UPI003394F233